MKGKKIKYLLGMRQKKEISAKKIEKKGKLKNANNEFLA